MRPRPNPLSDLMEADFAGLRTFYFSLFHQSMHVSYTPRFELPAFSAPNAFERVNHSRHARNSGASSNHCVMSFAPMKVPWLPVSTAFASDDIFLKCLSPGGALKPRMAELFIWQIAQL